MTEPITGRLVYDLAIAIFGGAIVGGLLLQFLQQNWPRFRSLFDEELRRQSKQISGTWNATEIYSKHNETAKFTVELECEGGRVRGKHTCNDGPKEDVGREFLIEDGAFKNQILTFRWGKKGPRALESGTVTAKLIAEGQLKGHGLYIEPEDGMVYTSTFSATIQH